MIKFRRNGIAVAVAENPNWVRLQDNGAYGLCQYEDAQGVAIKGTVYNLPGQHISDNGDVTLEILEIETYVFKDELLGPYDPDEISDEEALNIIKGVVG